MGTKWAELITAEAARLEKEEMSKTFYGKNSKAMFTKRLNAMKALTTYADGYLNGADSATRIQLIAILERSQARLGNEILQTPMPENIPLDAQEQLKSSLRLNLQSRLGSARKRMAKCLRQSRRKLQAANRRL